jgi:hypothetical protein
MSFGTLDKIELRRELVCVDKSAVLDTCRCCVYKRTSCKLSSILLALSEIG